MSDLDDLLKLAETLHRARLWRTSSVEQTAAVILYGRELGLGPASALSNIAIVSGKPTLGAAAIGALIQRGNLFDYSVDRLDDEQASVTFYRQLDPTVPQHTGTSIGPRRNLGTSTFTMADARKAGLGTSPTWKNFPRNMLLARALANGARWFTPGVFGTAVYEPSELADVDTAPPVPPLGPPNATPAADLPDPLITPSGHPPVTPATAATFETGTPGGNGVAAPTITLEALARTYGADAVLAAAGGALPATDDELQAVADRLAAGALTVGVMEASAETEVAP